MDESFLHSLERGGVEGLVGWVGGGGGGGGGGEGSKELEKKKKIGGLQLYVKRGKKEENRLAGGKKERPMEKRGKKKEDEVFSRGRG